MQLTTKKVYLKKSAYNISFSLIGKEMSQILGKRPSFNYPSPTPLLTGLLRAALGLTHQSTLARCRILDGAGVRRAVGGGGEEQRQEATQQPKAL